MQDYQIVWLDSVLLRKRKVWLVRSHTECNHFLWLHWLSGSAWDSHGRSEFLRDLRSHVAEIRCLSLGCPRLEVPRPQRLRGPLCLHMTFFLHVIFSTSFHILSHKFYLSTWIKSISSHFCNSGWRCASSAKNRQGHCEVRWMLRWSPIWQLERSPRAGWLWFCQWPSYLLLEQSGFAEGYVDRLIDTSHEAQLRSIWAKTVKNCDLGLGIGLFFEFLGIFMISKTFDIDFCWCLLKHPFFCFGVPYLDRWEEEAMAAMAASQATEASRLATKLIYPDQSGQKHSK